MSKHKKQRVAIALIAMLAAAQTLPVYASAQEAPAHVVNLGDSFASGVGADSYRQGTEGNCYRSIYSTGEQVVAQLKNAGFDVNFTNVACSGATVNDLRKPYYNTVQLDALRTDTRLVFLSVGGNDIGISKYVNQCLNGDCAGSATLATMLKLPAMQANLSLLLSQIQTRSPEARIVLLGYGQPMTAGANAPGTPRVELDPICSAEYLSPNERRDGAQLTAALDLTLRTTAKTARQRGLDVTYITPYKSSLPWNIELDEAFKGKSVCDTTMDQQIYRGFDALAPQPLGDAAGQGAILHGAHRTDSVSFYGQMATKVILEAPGGGNLAAVLNS